jgi:hypothetical protein
MNNLTLLACRKLFFLEVVEAAEHIGSVSPRTWRYYEAGRNKIPDHIVSKMEQLLQRRIQLKQEMRDEALRFKERGEGRQAIPYYVTFEQYVDETGLTDRLEWRLDQSVKSILYVEGLVIFY